MALENIFHLVGIAAEERVPTSFQPVPDERAPLDALFRRQALARRRSRSLQVVRQLELERALSRSGR